MANIMGKGRSLIGTAYMESAPEISEAKKERSTLSHCFPPLTA